MKNCIAIFIPGMMTSLNVYSNAERSNRYAAAEIKSTETERVRLACLGVLPVKKYPLEISFVWICENKRTDPDNIAFAKKYILDGLQKAGVIKNDSWSFIQAFTDRFTLAEKGHDAGVNVFIYENE